MMNNFVADFRTADNAQMETQQDSEDVDDKTNIIRQVYEETILPKLFSTFNITPNVNDGTKSLISESIEEYVNKFCTAVHDVAPFPIATKNFEEYLVTWLSCAYTIESLEMLLRATNKPFNGEMSIRYSSCLSGFARVSAILGNNIKHFNPALINYVCDVYDILFGKKKTSFLEWDIFSMMTSLIFATRCMLFSISKEETVPKGNVLDHDILIAMFLVNIVRIVVTHEIKFPQDMITDDVTTEEQNVTSKKLTYIFQKYNVYNQSDWEIPSSTGLYIVQTVKEQSRTFLRCCSLLFHAITDVELPRNDSFDCLAAYLGIEADICEYFNNEDYYQFISNLIDSNECKLQAVKQNIRNKQSEDIVPIIQATPPIRQLIDLPEDYSDLINSVSLFTCPNNVRDDSRNPTMCLVCGEILCSQSFCCQKELDKNSVGACTYHVHTCGAGIGIFLRIRDSEILLLGINKGCFIPAPYLDEYGETDQGLRRGNPLRLCKERYEKLHIIWLSHGIHEEITRRTETQQNLFATQWHNL